MFHFDGTVWTSVPMHPSEGGTVEGLTELTSLYGFSPSSVFAVGDRRRNGVSIGVIVHYDGRTWREEPIDSIGALQSVWGSSETDMWSGGRHALLRREGATWKRVEFPARSQHVQFLRIAGTSASDVYLMGTSNGPADPYQYDYRRDLYHYDGNRLTIIDSFFVGMGRPPAAFGAEIKCIQNTLYSAGDGIFSHANGAWTRLAEVSNTKLDCLSGTSSSNIFAVGTRSMFLHFNGKDVHVYPIEYPDVPITSVWSCYDGVVAVGYDGWRSYIFRGR